MITVKLDTFEKVNEFVGVCNQFPNDNIDVKQGRQIIDGRSILGIYSLNLLKPLEISIDAKHMHDRHDFYKEIKKWSFKNNLRKCF